MNRNSIASGLLALAALVLPLAAQAQSSVAEDFTKGSTTNPWYFFNGACLTAGSATGVEPLSGTGQVPGCTTIASSYYNKTTGEVLVGGYNGTFPDPSGNGALRFTNGYPYGYKENGGILSTTPFPTGQGVSITFKTVTYLGNSGGGGADGADGISFFLMDSSKLDTSSITGQAAGDGNGLGAWGGSLGYSCSNSNTPYNGLNGGYLGLGIDEYGNFLNGTTNTLGESGTTASGDNTATGGGYQPGRIGLRGAGSISWNALNTAYGTDPGNSSAPYYPAALLTSCAINGGSYDSNTGGCMGCSAGTYNLTTGKCDTTNCSSGTYNATTGLCESCGSGQTYDPANNNCVTKTCSTGTYNSTTGLCDSCPAGDTYNSGTHLCATQSCASGTYNPGANKCETCVAGTYNLAANKCEICSVSGYTTYDPATVKCWNPTHTISKTPTTGTPSASSPTNISPNTGPTNRVAATGSATQSPTPSKKNVDSYLAVQNTCKTGNLWNYATPANPQNAGAASLTNALNTAGILDYGALPLGYTVLPTGTQIAAESATTRGAAVPIYYQLKISQNGLLSLSYALCPAAGCGAWQGVLTNQNITTANGPLPANFLFGFAGSTGGSSNIHEILCFRADPATTAASSAGASEKQSAKLETGVQAYFAYYNPSNGYTGRVTASSLGFDQYGNVVVASTPNWDASCVLTGVLSGATCSTTGVSGPLTAQLPNSPGTAGARQIITWNGSGGVPFQYNNLSAAEQTAITLDDASATADRVNFLRGDRTNEINSAGAGEFRRRTGVLSDIVDSSPVWVGAPGAPYTTTWHDRINVAASLPENSSGAQTYPGYASAALNRTQVVYVGANDGLLHGFRSGVYNSSQGSCATTPSSSCFSNNDGRELLAYFPGALISGTSSQLIHPDISNSANVAIDFSNAQYGHNYFVNATPGAGDVFYNSQWHSWLVGGLGAGGAAIYALDVTDPSTFSESNASSLVMGEWNSATISCVGNANCGQSLGNTYGTPQIRRLHDGKWAVIFGNGIGSASGDGGIFIMTLDPTGGAQGASFYYLSTGVGSSGSPNGITFVTPADFDGDHISDYVYAGDIQGHVWRFDLTSPNESAWMVTPGPIFNTGGQPITTQVVVASGSPSVGMQQQIMVLFGTGQKVGFSNASASSYSSGTQTLYGVWDWNVTASDGGRLGPGGGNPSGWDGLSTAQYAGLTRASAGVITLTTANLQAQTVTIDATTQNRDIMNNATICWSGGCPSSAARQFGWYLNLPGAGEQVIYSPELVAQALTVNSIVPANNSPISCSNTSDTGFTYVLSAMTGGAFDTVFLPPSEAANPNVANQAAYADAHAIAMQTNATGSSFITSNSAGTQYLVYETNQVESGNGGSGSNNILGGTLGLNLPPNTTGHRLSWIELR
ncbi:MAG TPA: PilC/PilY family type IV pilus protein [Steroidobacteraceae bacterium]|nr:PilC/PilY family type IV pilus protein [Steroidobacteraceae bacterium]